MLQNSCNSPNSNRLDSVTERRRGTTSRKYVAYAAPRRPSRDAVPRRLTYSTHLSISGDDHLARRPRHSGCPGKVWRLGSAGGAVSGLRNARVPPRPPDTAQPGGRRGCAAGDVPRGGAEHQAVPRRRTPVGVDPTDRFVQGPHADPAQPGAGHGGAARRSGRRTGRGGGGVTGAGPSGARVGAPAREVARGGVAARRRRVHTRGG